MTRRGPHGENVVRSFLEKHAGTVHEHDWHSICKFAEGKGNAWWPVSIEECRICGKLRAQSPRYDQPETMIGPLEHATYERKEKTS